MRHRLCHAALATAHSVAAFVAVLHGAPVEAVCAITAALAYAMMARASPHGNP